MSILAKLKAVAVHYALAVVGGMLLGFIPEIVIEGALGQVYAESRLTGFSLGMSSVAGVLGFVLYRWLPNPMAKWVWIIGVAWLAFGFYDIGHTWSPSWDYRNDRWEYTIDNLFGPTSRCGSSECLGLLFYTTPMACSVTYSLGALLAIVRTKRRITVQAQP